MRRNTQTTQSHVMCDIPDAVKQALNARQFKTTAFDGDDDVVAVGDLRVATAVPGQPTDPRIVLVLGIDEDNEFVDVLFVHTAPENATDRDAIVSAGSSGAAYDTVVQTDLRTVLWCSQLGTRIGNVDETLVGTIKTWGWRQATQPQNTDRSGDRNATAGIVHGIPLRGIADRRWRFKESEGAAARRLANDCVDTLLNRDETSLGNSRARTPGPVLGDPYGV